MANNKKEEVTVIKVKEEISEVIQKVQNNFDEIKRLFTLNGELMENMLKNGIECVDPKIKVININFKALDASMIDWDQYSDQIIDAINKADKERNVNITLGEPEKPEE